MAAFASNGSVWRVAANRTTGIEVVAARRASSIVDIACAEHDDRIWPVKASPFISCGLKPSIRAGQIMRMRSVAASRHGDGLEPSAASSPIALPRAPRQHARLGSFSTTRIVAPSTSLRRRIRGQRRFASSVTDFDRQRDGEDDPPAAGSRPTPFAHRWQNRDTIARPNPVPPRCATWSSRPLVANARRSVGFCAGHADAAVSGRDAGAVDQARRLSVTAPFRERLRCNRLAGLRRVFIRSRSSRPHRRCSARSGCCRSVEPRAHRVHERVEHCFDVERLQGEAIFLLRSSKDRGCR